MNTIEDVQRLKVSKELLLENNLSIDENLYVSFFYVDEFDDISGDNFSLTIDFQADSIANFTCPGIRILVMGEVETHAVTLSEKGCVHGAFAKFGEEIRSGKNNDLSSFGINVYERQQLKMDIKEKNGLLYLNGQKILKTSYSTSIGNIVGFCFSFTGTGQIHSMKLNNNANGTSTYEY